MTGMFSTEWLVDTAAAVTLLIALVLLLRGPVMRAFGPQFAYALWLLPLGRAVMPPITLTIDAPAPVAAQAILVPLSAAAPSAPPAAIDWTWMVVALWLAGALALTGHAVLSYIRLRRAIARDASLLDINGRVAIVESDAVDGPVAIGVVSPLVVLPRDFAATFTPAEQRHVIAHELEHHRGHDLALNLVAFTLLAANWFNPIAWVGWRAFRQDQEAACDARTLARTGGDRASYGRAIAAAVAGPLIRPAAEPTPAFALAMGEKSALFHRLRSLAMTDLPPHRRWWGRAAIAAAALLVLPLTASVSYAVAQPAPPAPPPPPPAQPVPPVPPAPPTPPEAPDAPQVEVIDMRAAPGEHVRRIERDGRTIILRTNRELSDADVERMVAEAEASRAAADVAVTSSQNGQRRIIIRQLDRAESRETSTSDGQQTRVRVVTRHGGGAGAAARIHAEGCANGARPLVNVDRRSGDSAHVRILTCATGDIGSAQRLAALRQARDSLRDARADLAANLGEARTQALAELDAQIAELEREAGN